MWFWRIAWKELKEQSDITITFPAQKANIAIKYWLWEQSSSYEKWFSLETNGTFYEC